MSEGRGGGMHGLAGLDRGCLNTHVHLPPNFSAFRTVEDAVETAAAEGILVLGASNFHDLGVYQRFGPAADRAGVLPLFGFEVIAALEDQARAGTRVNDPENPGRAYVCGKGVAGHAAPGDEARRLLDEARALNVERIGRMVGLVRDRLSGAGLPADLSHESIVEQVAADAGVPSAWVVLQERHVAEAAQAAIFERLPPDRRRGLLELVYGAPAAAGPDDAMGVQREIRARLIKVGGPAFVPESPLSLADATRLILELEGIPCYPILADGATPVCEWEEPPAALAARLASLGIVAAELIPVRNRPEVVDTYVAALRSTGIVVMAGTEHNTRARIPLEPRCADGSLPSPAALDAFAEATCVVVAHQHLRAEGRPGFVDRTGAPAPGFPDGEARIRWFRDLGADLIAEHALSVAR
jgi:hypothetical protein